MIEVRDRPRDYSIADFRNIFIVLAQRVRQLFNNVLTEDPHPIFLTRLQKVRGLGQLFDYLSCDRSSFSSASSPYVNNCFKTSHLIILFTRLQEVRELGLLF